MNKKLINKLDKVFSKYIRARDKRCVTCGRVDDLQCGHLFTRSSMATRWDEMNAYCQCAICNSIHEHNPKQLMEYAITKHGKMKIEEMMQRHKKSKKMNEGDIILLIEKYDKLRKKI